MAGLGKGDLVKTHHEELGVERKTKHHFARCGGVFPVGVGLRIITNSP